MKSKPIAVLKIFVSLGLLALVFSHLNLSKVGTQLHNLSWLFVVSALLYYTGCQWLSCVRWQVVLRCTGHLVPISTLFSSYFAGMFLNNFLPSFGGDAYRIYRVAQKSKDPEAALVSVFLERFTGLAALLGLALLGLPAAFRLVRRWDIILMFVICVGVLVGGTLLIVSPWLLIWVEPCLIKFRLHSFASRFAQIQIYLRKFAKNRLALALSIALSLLLQLAIVYYHYLITQNLKIPISYLELLVFIPMIVVATLLPISIGGLGVKEGLWVYLFNRIGLSVEQALLLSLTTTLFAWLLGLPGAVILLLDAAGVERLKHSKEN